MIDKLIPQLFQARDAAHRIHLVTRSFAAHMALGDLYEALVGFADEIAESYQGKYGVVHMDTANFAFEPNDPRIFINQLATWAESMKAAFSPADTHLLSAWDDVLNCIYKTKYKLENLA